MSGDEKWEVVCRYPTGALSWSKPLNGNPIDLPFETETAALADAQARIKRVRLMGFTDYLYYPAKYPHGLDTFLPSTQPILSTPTRSLPADLSDWRTWRDVNRAADECACGCKRAVCEYHR